MFELMRIDWGFICKETIDVFRSQPEQGSVRADHGSERAVEMVIVQVSQGSDWQRWYNLSEYDLCWRHRFFSTASCLRKLSRQFWRDCHRAVRHMCRKRMAALELRTSLLGSREPVLSLRKLTSRELPVLSPRELPVLTPRELASQELSAPERGQRLHFRRRLRKMRLISRVLSRKRRCRLSYRLQPHLTTRRDSPRKTILGHQTAHLHTPETHKLYSMCLFCGTPDLSLIHI